MKDYCYVIIVELYRICSDYVVLLEVTRFLLGGWFV